MSYVYRAQSRRAAKHHRCDECAKTIDVGEHYVAWFQIFEGEAWNGHTCALCDAIRGEVWRCFDWPWPDEAPGLGELRTFLLDEHGIADAEAWYAERLALREARELIDGLARRAVVTFQTGARP